MGLNRVRVDMGDWEEESVDYLEVQGFRFAEAHEPGWHMNVLGVKSWVTDLPEGVNDEEQ